MCPRLNHLSQALLSRRSKPHATAALFFNMRKPAPSCAARADNRQVGMLRHRDNGPSSRLAAGSRQARSLLPPEHVHSLPAPGKETLAVRQPWACHPTSPGQCCRIRVQQVEDRRLLTRRSPPLLLPSLLPLWPTDSVVAEQYELMVLGEAKPYETKKTGVRRPPRQSGSWSESRLGQSAFGARPGRSAWGQSISAPAQMLAQRAARAPWCQAGASLPVPVIKYAGTRNALRAYKELLQTTFLALRHRRLRRPFRGAPA